MSSLYVNDIYNAIDFEVKNYYTESDYTIECYHKYNIYLKRLRQTDNINYIYIDRRRYDQFPNVFSFPDYKNIMTNTNIIFTSDSFGKSLIALFLFPQVYDITLENMIIMDSSTNIDEVTSAIFDTYPFLYKFKKLHVQGSFWIDLLKLCPWLSSTL